MPPRRQLVDFHSLPDAFGDLQDRPLNPARFERLGRALATRGREHQRLGATMGATKT
jgi:hypothetical protein